MVAKRRADHLEREIHRLREKQSNLEEQLEDYVHHIQVNMQGLLTDAELLVVSLEDTGLDRCYGDASDILQKVLILINTSNNIRPNLGALEFVRVGASRMVESAIKTFLSLASSRGIEIVYNNTYEEEVHINASPNHLHHALSNILHNAVKYSYLGRPKRRTVDVTMSRHSDAFLQIKVVNYGVPIDPDEVAHLGNAGFRGRHASDRFRTGSGRGLFATKNILEQHKGRIEITSTPMPGGAGVTVVKIFLPIHSV